MSKKKQTFRTLSLNTLPKASAALETEVVEVPEFGEGMTVNARPLTVHLHAFLGMYLGAMGYDSQKAKDDASTGEPSEAKGEPSLAAAAYSSLNAALGSYDDDGNLVFGETPESAVRLVLSLPSGYAPAIRRISAVVTRLTNASNPQRAVEEAEKN